MFKWFRNKKHPDFWIDYKNKFKKEQSNEIDVVRFVVLDTETTGLNIKTDKILSIGAIALTDNIITIADSLECYLEQSYFNPETVKIHGILKKGIDKVSEKTALESFIKYIGNAVIIAHHVAFDVSMINQALKNNNLPKLKNKVVDTGFLYKKLKNIKPKHYSLDYLCNQFNVPKHDRHTASGDAYITALLFLKILSKLKSEQKVYLSDLFVKNRTGLLM